MNNSLEITEEGKKLLKELAETHGFTVEGYRYRLWDGDLIVLKKRGIISEGIILPDGSIIIWGRSGYKDVLKPDA